MAGLTLLLSAGAVSAQTAGTTFAVRAQVTAVCSVSAQDLDFGAYTSNTAATASNAIIIQCSPGSAATVSLDGGSSGNPQARTMSGPGTLNYQIYRDAALSDPINSGGAAWQLSSSANTGQSVTYTVYGQIPAGQNVAAGGYVDTITVTVQY